MINYLIVLQLYLWYIAAQLLLTRALLLLFPLSVDGLCSSII